MHSALMKAAILSISLLTVMASAAISPALARIRQAFPGADITLIKLVLTLPSLVIIPFTLVSGWLLKFFKKKQVLMAGLVIYLVTGVGAGFAKTIGQLLFIRALFGIGVGLIIPLSTALIADFFEGEERTKMMGLSGSVSHFGGVIFTLLAGWLACISWRLAFGVYGLTLVIILMVMLWVPEPQSSVRGGIVKGKLPGGVYVCAVLGALMMVAFYAAPTNLAMFIESERQMYTSTQPLFKNRQELIEHLKIGTISDVTRESFAKQGIKLSSGARLSVKEPGKVWVITDKSVKYIVRREPDRLVVSKEHLGRPGIAGYFLSTMTIVGVISGAILAFLVKLFRGFLAAVGIAAMGVGYFILGISTTLTTVFIAMLCIGFSSGVLMPLLLLRVAKITPPNLRTFGMAVVSIGVYLGQFLSPLILKGTTVILKGMDPFRAQFHSLAWSLWCAAFIGAIITVKNLKSPSATEEIRGFRH